MNGTFYKALEFIVSEKNRVLSLMRVLYVGRHDFGPVNPEIRIAEGRITEILLYQLSNMNHTGQDLNHRPQRLSSFVHLTFDCCIKVK